LICAQVLIFVQQVQRRTCLGVFGEQIFPSSFLSAWAGTPAWFFLACFSSGLRHARSACSAIYFLPLARAQAAAVIQFTRAARLGAGPFFLSLGSPAARFLSISSGAHQDPDSRVHSSFFKFFYVNYCRKMLV
jgi:hypothetical protein